MSGSIGMHDAPGGIDQKHRGRKPVERVGKRRRFDLVQVDHLADRDGAAHMRDNKLHPPPRFVIDNIIMLVADGGEGRIGRGGLFQCRRNGVDPMLRPNPFFIKARFPKL